MNAKIRRCVRKHMRKHQPALAMRFSTLHSIQQHLTHAREKHQWSDDMTDCEKYRIVERELHEMGVAMLKGDKRGAKAEALDCIAVLVRIVEGD